MHSYYWEAIYIDTDEQAGGICFAQSEDAAIEQIESYGFYREIVVSECR